VFDPYAQPGVSALMQAWMEELHGDDWTLDPALYGYKTDWRPSDYVVGWVAKSWEFADPSTYVVHLRQGISWQNIYPANGREFTADDVVYHYNRNFGLGSGMTPSTYNMSSAMYQNMTSVTATDKYTVVFKWKISNPELIVENMQALGGAGNLENSDAVKIWGDLNDWHHAIGTGPFILQDFVSSSSATLIKNPNYWGHDERYPQNQLPYLDGIKILIIPNDATALAALRTGKIDVIAPTSFANAQLMQKTNPEILQLTVPATNTITIDPRNDVAPFKDIRVRQAMQEAIDLPTIASSVYGGNAPPHPSALTGEALKGYGWPYDQWPQDLKDQYAYNPTAAKKLLADAGYPTGFKTDIVVDNSGDMDVIQVVKSYFAQVGIDMEIRPMDPVSWVAFVRTTKKYDQLANQATNGNLGLIYEPSRQLQRLTLGYATNWLMVNDSVMNADFAKYVAATSIDDVKQALQDANKRAAQQFFSISLLAPNNYYLYQPWLKGYNGQSQSLQGTNFPLLIGFYGARFWIDQKIKK